jgi:hypothetical protein
MAAQAVRLTLGEVLDDWRAEEVGGALKWAQVRALAAVVATPPYCGAQTAHSWLDWCPGSTDLTDGTSATQSSSCMPVHHFPGLDCPSHSRPAKALALTDVTPGADTVRTRVGAEGVGRAGAPRFAGH